MASERMQKTAYLYLCDEDREVITSCCNVLRRTRDSRQNLFYIIANFGEFSMSSVFDAEPLDAQNYITFLADEMKQGKIQEQYCACIFSELRIFYDYALSHGLVSQNPFSNQKNPFKFPDKLRAADLPSLTEVDLLLRLCENEPVLYLAVLLAFRMALPISEIATIQKNQFCVNEKDGDLYLKMWRWIDGEKKEKFLYVPRDIVPHITKMARQTPAEYLYLLRNKHNKPFVVRTLQLRLDAIQKDTGIKIQFSELRSLCIYLMLTEKIPSKKICAFTNIRGDWLKRYDYIPEELILDATKYIHIRITG